MSDDDGSDCVEPENWDIDYLFGGANEDETLASGASLSFHFGADFRVSVLRLDLEAFQSERQSTVAGGAQSLGVRAILGATLIF